MGKLMPICVLVVVATSTVATASAHAQTLTPVPAPPPSTRTIRAFGDLLKVAGCVLGVATFVAGNTVLVLKIKKVGGIVNFAKRLWKAKSRQERAKLVYQTLGTLSGVTGFVAACTP